MVTVLWAVLEKGMPRRTEWSSLSLEVWAGRAAPTVGHHVVVVLSWAE